LDHSFTQLMILLKFSDSTHSSK